MRQRPDEGTWFVVDRGYRILDGYSAGGTIEENVGRVLWDAYVDSRAIYEAVYEQAWRLGNASCHAFYLGHLVHVMAERKADTLRVSYLVVEKIETVTLAALAQSLGLIQDHLLGGSPGCGARPAGGLRPLAVVPDLIEAPPTLRR